MRVKASNQTIFASSTIPQRPDGPAPDHGPILLEPVSPRSLNKVSNLRSVLCGKGRTNSTDGGIVKVLPNCFFATVIISFVEGKVLIPFPGLYASLNSINFPITDESTVLQRSHMTGSGVLSGFSDRVTSCFVNFAGTQVIYRTNHVFQQYHRYRAA
jgi:hypothetical protein